jgi:Flp pilus assembly protein TadG
VRNKTQNFIERFNFTGIADQCKRATFDSECGSGVAEFAMTVGVLFGFIFTILASASLLYTYAMLSETARESSRYASMHSSTCVTSASASCTSSVSQIQTYTLSLHWPNIAGGTMGTPSVTYKSSNIVGDYVTVTVSYSFPTLAALPQLNGLNIHSSSTSVIVQ